MNNAIFPPRLAAAYVRHAGDKYRPSNGTEGQMFLDAFCRRCQRDDAERCEILNLTMIHSIDDPEFPNAWQYGRDGQPCCTQFAPVGEPIPAPRCTQTMELF